MNTTGLFTAHEVVVNCKAGDSFKLFPFGDIHRDSDLHADGEWREFLAYAKKQKNALFLGMGDYSDGISTSERIIIGDPKLHDTTRRTMDQTYKRVGETLAQELAFMKGRLLGLIGGNHYWLDTQGENSDAILANALGTKFLGVCSFIRITFNTTRGAKPDAHRTGPTLDLFVHHGKGGGSLPGSTFNSIEKMLATADADIYLMGHDHKKGCIPSTPRLRLTVGAGGKLNIKERTPWLGRTGSFLKAYESGRVSYNVDCARSACSLGWIEFDLTVKRDQTCGRDVTSVSIRGTT